MQRSTKAPTGPAVTIDKPILHCARKGGRRSRYNGNNYNTPEIPKAKGEISDKQLRETFEDFLDFYQEKGIEPQELEDREYFVRGISAEAGVSRASLILTKDRTTALRLLKYFRPFAQLN